ncbi:MAG: OadG family protein [Floccifex sp.]
MIESLTIAQGLQIALYGFTTVFIMLAILMLIITVMNKVIVAITSKQEKAEEKVVEEVVEVKKPTNVEYAGEIQLIDVDEKTAACIMAIISDETNIPLENLIFKKIRLLEDN